MALETEKHTSKCRNFVIWSAVAVAIFVFAKWGFRSLVGTVSLGAMGVSEKVAALLGLTLILLSLAGPVGALSPAVALVGAVVLIAITTVLSIAAWPLMDELSHTISRETGNMAFYPKMGQIYVWPWIIVLILHSLA